jgi:hypothetical protein
MALKIAFVIFSGSKETIRPSRLRICVTEIWGERAIGSPVDEISAFTKFAP